MALGACAEVETARSSPLGIVALCFPDEQFPLDLLESATYPNDNSSRRLPRKGSRRRAIFVVHEVTMLHEPAAQEKGKDPSFAWKRRLGVNMFFIYAIIYAVFTAINVASPRTMESVVFAGLNLAVVYGFGLIIVALVMALIYNAACSARERAMPEGAKR